MIYTGYYANMKKMPENERYALVSISRGNPSWMPDLLDVIELKPSWEMVELAKSHDYERYVQMYQEKLSRVRLQDILNQIPDESILLCYESPDKFCHRHMVRNWLNSYGILCRELTF